MKPDLDGFRDAAVRMRAELGTAVPFFAPVDLTYPPGTSLDDSGKPFDPTVEPIGASGVEPVGSAVVGVYTARIPATREDEVVRTPVGWFENGNIVLDADPDDYEAISAATEIEWLGDRYEITDIEGSKIGDVEHRKLLFCRRM